MLTSLGGWCKSGGNKWVLVYAQLHLYITLEDPFHSTYTHLPQQLFFSSLSTSFQPTSSRIIALGCLYSRPASRVNGRIQTVAQSGPISFSLPTSGCATRIASLGRRPKDRVISTGGRILREGGWENRMFKPVWLTLEPKCHKHDSIPQVMMLTHPCLPNTM